MNNKIILITGTNAGIGKSIVKLLEKENKRPQKIIIASNEIEGNIVRDLLTFSDKTGISLARLPKITDLESDINDKKPKINILANIGLYLIKIGRAHV